MSTLFRVRSGVSLAGRTFPLSCRVRGWSFTFGFLLRAASALALRLLAEKGSLRIDGVRFVQSVLGFRLGDCCRTPSWIAGPLVKFTKSSRETVDAPT